MTVTIAVCSLDSAQQRAAQDLAANLQLPYAENAAADYDYFLIFTAQGLGLQKQGDKASPLIIDFLSKATLYRCQQATVKRELLARALGLKSGKPCTIIDATAGLGRDGFILAALGFEIILLERSPIIHALLNDALQRAALHPLTANITQRISLHHTDACNFLHLHPNQAQAIYLDPMFPARTKSALVKKEMRYLQDLTDETNNTDAALLNRALDCDANRVVVKRPRLAAALTKHPVSFSLLGTSNRFDIYLKDRRGNSA